jgi:protein-disulfide isomerase
VRGAAGAPLVIEYGDYECPYCARADALLRELPVRRVFRHFPVVSKHPRARVLAEAAEAAALQGAYWEFHDSLYADQGRLDDPHLWARCEALGLDLDRFQADRRDPAIAERVRRDVRDALRAGATTTPTLFTHPSSGGGSPR